MCNRARIPGSNLRADGINHQIKVIRELKPDTASGIQAMQEAETKYMGAIEKTYGKNHGWSFEAHYYKAPWKK